MDCPSNPSWAVPKNKCNLKCKYYFNPTFQVEIKSHSLCASTWKFQNQYNCKLPSVGEPFRFEKHVELTLDFPANFPGISTIFLCILFYSYRQLYTHFRFHTFFHKSNHTINFCWKIPEMWRKMG